MAYAIVTAYTDKQFIHVGDKGSFDFKNDIGTTLKSGQPVVINDGTDKHIAIIDRDADNGQIASARLCKLRRIFQAPFGGGANVAVGEILSIEAVSGNLLKNTVGEGRFIALPKQAKTMSGASAAAATTDTSILVFEK